jgi:hypothetical protein
MHTDGGGWMLVGRSVEGEFGGGLFGWGAARGDVDDLSAPYALDAITAGLQFTHILMGNRNEGMQWGNHVYRLRVPADFLDAVDAAVPTEQVDVVVGDCEPIGGPTMLHFGGYTGTPEFFFFRDLDAHAQHGLLHDGFDMFWDDVFGCINGGGLHGDQGMIFVR